MSDITNRSLRYAEFTSGTLELTELTDYDEVQYRVEFVGPSGFTCFFDNKDDAEELYNDQYDLQLDLGAALL